MLKSTIDMRIPITRAILHEHFDSSQHPIRKDYISSNISLALFFFGGGDEIRRISHSFRIGIASHFADCGMSDGKIKLLGRSKSDDFKLYTRPVNLCN